MSTTINIQPIEKLIQNNGSVLEVHSIFYTIQGEGPFCGRPAVFVRLAGCNLKCPSCDTDYTDGRTLKTVDQILTNVWLAHDSNYKLKPLVVISGGEPFRQNITPLVDELMGGGYVVQIETNGTLPPPDGLNARTVIVCSPKTGKINLLTAYRAACFKYVMSHDSIDSKDGLPILALNHTAKPQVARPPKGINADIYLQPMDSKDPEENARNLKAVKDSCMKFGYRLQLQIHKLIGVE